MKKSPPSHAKTSSITSCILYITIQWKVLYMPSISYLYEIAGFNPHSKGHLKHKKLHIFIGAD